VVPKYKAHPVVALKRWLGAARSKPDNVWTRAQCFVAAPTALPQSGGLAADPGLARVPGSPWRESPRPP